jgi:hypothetical protein
MLNDIHNSHGRNGLDNIRYFADILQMEAQMAHLGNGFFDKRGHYFKSPEEASASDLAAILGRIGDGESLAPGIAMMLIDKRKEIEDVFAQHDEMVRLAAAPSGSNNITALPVRTYRDT